ncbi:MAG: hypothetical protein GWP08_09625 [Nitrospiraceae bacterium]|nr:hypothetical protein [Nitrospiraceae bacterium]
MNVLLVIASEHGICESLRAALPDSDLLLFEPDVERALRRLVTMKVDAVILDDVPRTGRPALARLLEANPGTPALVLAGRGDTETLAGWTMAGARACVPKPFSCQDLQEALATALRPPQVPATIMPAPWNPDSTLPVASDSFNGATVGQHRMALRWLSRTSSRTEDPRRVCHGLVEAATDIFDVVRSAVLFEAGGHVRVVASHGISPNVADSLRLDYGAGLMRWLGASPCVFDPSHNPYASDACKEMQLLGGRFAVPLMNAGCVTGALVLGDKASGLPYSVEERELLSVIGRCASAALEKAQTHRDSASQQSRLNGILANITSGVVTVLPNRTISMMNQQAESILRVRAVEVLGRSVQKLGSGFADVVLRTLADGRPRLRQEVHDPAINGMLGLSVTSMGSDGAVVVFAKLPEESVSRDDIAYSPFWEYLSERVAQEIKNPMVAINTFAQLLPRKYDSEEFREAFGRVVQKEVARINSVVETLFDFSSTPDLVLRRSDLNETVRGVLQSFEDALLARAIDLEADLDPDAAEADLDPSHFSEVLHNVVQNSIDAMPEGGTLSVSTKKVDGTCEVVIADTGPGIAAEDASQVFLPFFSTKERGMGLGLSTAMRIVQQHDGDLKIVDRPEGGTAFAVSVPATRAHHENDSSD